MINSNICRAGHSLSSRRRAVVKQQRAAGATGVALHLARDSVCRSVNILPVLKQSRATALLQVTIATFSKNKNGGLHG